MKHKLLYIFAALLPMLPMASCDNDFELPPMIMPDMQGDGTAANPFNVAAAIAQARVNGESSTVSYFTKGVVTEATIDVSYGNGEFVIADDPASDEATLIVYRAKDLDNQRFTDVDKVQVGDTIVVYAPIVNYKGNTPETSYGYIYSINGLKSSTTPADPVVTPDTSGDDTSGDDTSGDDAPSGDGTASSPYNPAKAKEVAEALSDSEQLADKYVEGVVASISELSTDYGNATYTIGSSAGASVTFSIYRGYYLDGAKFTSTDQLKVGDKVVVKGTIVNYKGNTPQMTTGSQIVSINE